MINNNILGLDIGGANLKAATSAGRALSLPFAVWKKPAKLGAKIAELVAQFPEANAVAATMTAELCDCYETKRIGVHAIVDALTAVNENVRIWSTDGKFIIATAAKKQYMKVAAANWHALATYATRHVKGHALLIDTGTTTTDLIPLIDGRVAAIGKTDYERMTNYELCYTGWKRTSVMAMAGLHLSAAEHFSTMQDVHIILGHVPPDPVDTDTADGRSATLKNAYARLARMKCCDVAERSVLQLKTDAEHLAYLQRYHIRTCVRMLQARHAELCDSATLVVSGSGGFLVRMAVKNQRHDAEPLAPFRRVVVLDDKLGVDLAAAAPAYAVAMLASEASGAA